MSKSALICAIALIAVLLLVVVNLPSSTHPISEFERFADYVTHRATAQEAAPPSLAAPMPGDAYTLSHDSPPAEELLANDVAAQAAYDSTAKEGEFVTPPRVSIEH